MHDKNGELTQNVLQFHTVVKKTHENPVKICNLLR
jgi:hypothetical protein